MKQETLEEISKEMYKGEYICNGIDLIPVWREGFILGVEFQQERSYGEEDLKYAYEQGARLALLSQSPLALHKGEFPNPEEWFNQYKEENKIWK
jgi:hypothetical protein